MDGLEEMVYIEEKNIFEKIREIKGEEEKLRQREEKLREIKSS